MVKVQFALKWFLKMGACEDETSKIDAEVDYMLLFE